MRMQGSPEGTGSASCEADSGSGCLSYKKLYHAAVERGCSLQEQLEKFSELLSKHHKIAELKVTCSEDCVG